MAIQQHLTQHSVPQGLTPMGSINVPLDDMVAMPPDALRALLLGNQNGSRSSVAGRRQVLLTCTAGPKSCVAWDFLTAESSVSWHLSLLIPLLYLFSSSFPHSLAIRSCRCRPLHFSVIGDSSTQTYHFFHAYTNSFTHYLSPLCIPPHI